MKAKTHVLVAAVASVLLLAGPAANAQMAVIDAQSLGQLQQQVQYWQQQIMGMANQITTLRAQLASLTGLRGMGNVLRVTLAQRNYLPQTAADILAAASGAQSTNSMLRSTYAAALSSQAAVSPAVAATLSQSDLLALTARRGAVAARSSAMQVAIANASARFTQLQALIDEVDRTTDPKASLDLQGRIAAEQVMAINESAKLAAIAGWTESNIQSAQTHATEAALTAHGAFAQRFHPTAR